MYPPKKQSICKLFNNQVIFKNLILKAPVTFYKNIKLFKNKNTTQAAKRINKTWFYKDNITLKLILLARNVLWNISILLRKCLFKLSKTCETNADKIYRFYKSSFRSYPGSAGGNHVAAPAWRDPAYVAPPTTLRGTCNNVPLIC